AAPATVAAAGAPKPPEIKPGPPPVLTKRGADILVQVEKLLDEAAKTTDKTSVGEPGKPTKPVSSSAVSFPDSFAAATAGETTAHAPRKNWLAGDLIRSKLAADIHHFAGIVGCRRGRPGSDLDDCNARHRCRHADHWSLDRASEKRDGRHRSLFARHDHAQWRAADRNRRRRAVCSHHGRPQETPRWPLRHSRKRRHAGSALLDADAVRQKGAPRRQLTAALWLHQSGNYPWLGRLIRNSRGGALACRQLAPDRRDRAVCSDASPLRYAGGRRHAHAA